MKNWAYLTNPAEWQYWAVLALWCVFVLTLPFILDRITHPRGRRGK